jgi:nucleotide-binding universal stress UspA family protein
MTTEQPGDHRIVVGTDGSPSSSAALAWAAHQAELTGAALEVLMTWEWPVTFAWSVVPNEYDPGGDCGKVLAETLAPIRAAHPDLPIRANVVEGHPAPILVKASRGADLLVVGSRGHGAFTGMLLGSVSEHCVSNAHCPVLVMRDGESPEPSP